MTASQIPGPSSPDVLLAVQALWTGEALADPYPGYERLRALGNEGGVLPVPEWNAAFVTGHAAVSAILRSPAARSSEAGSSEWMAGQGGAGQSEGGKLLGHMMLFHNGLSHARLRGLVQKAFTPRVVEEQRELVRSLLDTLLRDLAAQEGPVDLVAGLANPLPSRVIMQMLGLRGEEEQKFTAWTASVAELIGGTRESPELLARIEQDAREMRSYFRDLADELRLNPQPGLLSALAAAEDGGERLSGDELLSNAVLLLGAGHETTSNLIPGGVLALSGQPASWAALVENPRHPGVADELLRFVSPVQLDGRHFTEDLPLGGAVLRAGSHAQLLLAAANRDPHVFPEPHRLDWNRDNAARHLAFAAGPHYCLGASLARLEIAETFAALAERFPGLRVQALPRFKANFVLRGPQALHVTLG
ncbi:Cytochrome P450 [Deinococcus reticulitermitis]|uniref:Cytochrome P450 n=1 Tax=Deinococcus reticulitermitis TaxID=856736 RepID=A0A1H6UKU2_9DEIO|nr:cytochrome P450 [Deinococcus reticulitermitis]SEI92918.1 Cytochrome P450 [Deinococcus reticulitermitis]